MRKSTGFRSTAVEEPDKKFEGFSNLKGKADAANRRASKADKAK